MFTVNQSLAPSFYHIRTTGMFPDIEQGKIEGRQPERAPLRSDYHTTAFQKRQKKRVQGESSMHFTLKKRHVIIHNKIFLLKHKLYAKIQK